MSSRIQKVAYLTPIVTVGAGTVAMAGGWTWSQFAGNAAGGALAGAVSAGAATLMFGTPAATVGAAIGGVAGAVGGAAYYSLTVAFG